MERLERIKQEGNRVSMWAAGLVVSNAEEYKRAVEGLRGIKALRKQWVTFWAPMKEKAYGAWKEIVAKEKQGTDLFDKAENIVKMKAIAWKTDADRKAAEEQRRLQAEADEKARRERERLAREAARLKTPEKQAERLEQAAAVQAPVVTMQAETKLDGAHTRTIWRARLVNESDLIAAAKPGTVAASFLSFNQKAADAFARSTKGAVSVPGVEFIEEKSMTISNTGGV